MNIFKNFELPVIYQLPNTKNILNNSASPVISSSVGYPLFNLGFQHYVHANKDKFDILDKFKNKKKVYEVVNRYNIKIDEYKKDLVNEMNRLTKENIDNNDFYKFWEILSLFDLLDKGAKTVANLGNMSDNVLGCMQAILNFRIILNETKDSFISPNTDIKDRRSKNKLTNVDLLIVDYDDKYPYRNLLEQDSFQIIVEQLLDGLPKLNKNGSLIIKIDEMYTKTTNKLICLLNACFSEGFIIKPLTSNFELSERFIVLKNLTSSDKCLKILNSLKIKKNYIVDFCPDYELDEEYVNTIRKLNTDISNRQLMHVNQIVEFINAENYYGLSYEKFRNQQIESTKFWLNRYINEKDPKKHIEFLRKNCKDIIKIYNERKDKLTKLISK